MHTTKVISAVVILLALVVATSLFSYNILASTSRALDDHIAQIEANTANIDWNKAKEQLSILESSWSKTQKTWSMLIDHMEIDNIDSTLSRMSKFIETRNTSSALAEAALLRQYIKHIPKKEALNWENLF